MPHAILPRWLCAPSILLVACAVVGCGGGGEELFPVQGQVKNGTEPLKTGTVQFYPDKDKGNPSESLPRAEIAEDGTYTLYTSGEEGAPAGWYKVVVAATEPVPEDAEGEAAYAPPTYLVREEYTSHETTPLTMEVKSDAPEDHYDISLEPK